MKVLLVEENYIYIKLITTFLSDLGYEIITSSKIEEAYEMWVKEQPDVIISALIFQEGSGIDFIHKVRNSISVKYTLIIVITSLKEKELLTETVLAGADEVLLKPFDIYELRSRLISGYRLTGIREQENEVVIYTLNQLFKYRNVEYNDHMERTTGYCKLIASFLKENNKFTETIDDTFIESISIASSTHDIGKMGISDELLNSDQIYTAAQYEEMKKHTTIGYEIITSIMEKYPNVQFLKMASLIARNHHERYDGTGYPDQLKGNEIPLCARITAIADTYDALTKNRKYKKAVSHEMAIAIIQSERESHFDPIITDVFIDNHERINNLRILMSE